MNRPHKSVKTTRLFYPVTS